MPDGIMVEPRLRHSFTTANDELPSYSPGSVWVHNDGDERGSKKYKYVKVTIGATNANSLIAGRPVYWDVKGDGTVRTDAGVALTDKTPAGVLLNTVTSGRYAFIQTAGRGEALVTNSAAANSPLVPAPAAGTLAVAAGSEAAPHVATNAETGVNPATPLTTTCDLYFPD